MNPRDTWLIGLLALAYLYLDSTVTPRPMSDSAFRPGPPPGNDESGDRSRLLPARVAARDVCPRNQGHRVSLRGDGAMWCRDCDEAFYPQGMIWESIMRTVAV